MLPRDSVRAFRGRWQGGDADTALAGAWTLAEIPLERLRLRDVTWIDRRDIALAYDGRRALRPRLAPARSRGGAPRRDARRRACASSAKASRTAGAC